MNKNIRENLKRITAFALSASMIIGMDSNLVLINAYAEENSEYIEEDGAYVEDTQAATGIVESEEEQTINETIESEDEQMAEECLEPEDIQTEEIELSETKYVDSEEHDGWVCFTNGYFIKALSVCTEEIYYYNGHKIIDEMESILISKYNYAEDCSVWVDPAALMGFTELKLVATSDTSGYNFTKQEWWNIDLSETCKLPNLQKLSMGGYFGGSTTDSDGSIRVGGDGKKYSNTLPSTLTDLSIEHLQLTSILDLSNCKNLKNLTISDLKYKNEVLTDSSRKNYTGFYELKGLDQTDDLISVSFYNTNIQKINLSNAVSDEAMASGLQIKVTECPELTEINLGGYSPKAIKYKDSTTKEFVYETSFRKCVKLEKLVIEHGKCTYDEILNLKECDSLKYLKLCYSFDNANSFLTIDSMGVVSSATGYCSLSFSDSSTNKYIMKAMTGTFMDNYAKKPENAHLFEKVDSVDSKPKYIVFAQDKEKFEKYKKTETMKCSL